MNGLSPWSIKHNVSHEASLAQFIAQENQGHSTQPLSLAVTLPLHPTSKQPLSQQCSARIKTSARSSINPDKKNKSNLRRRTKGKKQDKVVKDIRSNTTEKREQLERNEERKRKCSEGISIIFEKNNEEEKGESDNHICKTENFQGTEQLPNKNNQRKDLDTTVFCSLDLLSTQNTLIKRRSSSSKNKEYLNHAPVIRPKSSMKTQKKENQPQLFKQRKTRPLSNKFTKLLDKEVVPNLLTKPQPAKIKFSKKNENQPHHNLGNTEMGRWFAKNATSQKFEFANFRM